ncbi:GNAT family N-acetyltransferase [Ramlibacter algicola]|uniref:GNAT family N-acetyltransferase n=1 Tax=Ramlibacter algicola TaxID=2795217 RepID=A0A934Q1M7_9BURK|nr:GNAT family N-acetyltransferase [Ramlibacter algicola]
MQRATSVRLEQPDQPEVVALVEALDAYQKPLYPAESFHGIDLQALLRPDVLFAVARDEAGIAVGCGAIVLQDGVGEVKRMYVAPACRGRGAGRALLDFLEVQARSLGCREFVLETGYLQTEAIGLYERAGYERCGPFGDYTDDPNSVFLRKAA